MALSPCLCSLTRTPCLCPCHAPQHPRQGCSFTSPLHPTVITGGHYDVDCFVEDPNGRTIYKETKKQYDSFPHRTELQGVYTFCFSNEFSTFSHKTVYFDFQVGDEPPILPDMSNRVTALTQVGPRTLPCPWPPRVPP
uniref:GOLD domain-containing protein n=1 Tax=Calidris pygmaea TaxID=425635 RepID=A0A8C3JU07_9CHAR